MTRDPDVLSLAARERADFARFLATLTPRQWEQPSLCAGWSVRDVVAHMISYDELGWNGTLKRIARGRFMLNTINEIGVREYSRSPRELLDLVRTHQRPSGLTAAFGGMIALVDGLIHHQDIRRPLDLALSAPPIGARKRARGLTIVATDLDWSHGSGPEVRGPAEALLMALAGRDHALSDLEGAGHELLARRV